MHDFQEWDFVDKFTPIQAAALIRGFNPNGFAASASKEKWQPILAKILNAIQSLPPEIAVMSKDPTCISRTELSRWLQKNALPTQYVFARDLDSSKNPIIDRPLRERERRTLLVIFAALCKEAKIPYEKPAKAAAMIGSMLASMNVSIGESTIEGHLKKIPEALESRMK